MATLSTGCRFWRTRCKTPGATTPTSSPTAATRTKFTSAGAGWSISCSASRRVCRGSRPANRRRTTPRQLGSGASSARRAGPRHTLQDTQRVRGCRVVVLAQPWISLLVTVHLVERPEVFVDYRLVLRRQVAGDVLDDPGPLLRGQRAPTLGDLAELLLVHLAGAAAAHDHALRSVPVVARVGAGL